MCEVEYEANVCSVVATSGQQEGKWCKRRLTRRASTAAITANLAENRPSIFLIQAFAGTKSELTSFHVAMRVCQDSMKI